MGSIKQRLDTLAAVSVSDDEDTFIYLLLDLWYRAGVCEAARGEFTNKRKTHKQQQSKMHKNKK